MPAEPTLGQAVPVPPKGKVYLVGAGPGDPKLLTLRALELIQQADVVAHDALISPELLALIPAGVQLLPVGRRHGMGPTSYQLHPDVLDLALQGKTVVRLKSGDPLMFGRGGEEAETLVEAGIPFEFVPGITAALGAASYAGIPLTHRGLTTQVLLDTGHDADDIAPDSAPPPLNRLTVLYMAARRLKANLQRLQEEGYPNDTPAALIVSATTPRQKIYKSTLATLAEMVGELSPQVPAILFVGAPVALHDNLQWFQADLVSPRDSGV